MINDYKLRPQFDYSNTPGDKPSRPLLQGGFAIQQAEGILFSLRGDGTQRESNLEAISGDLGNIAFKALGAPNVRRLGDRANDFVMLADYMGGGRTLQQAIDLGSAAVVAKGGGRLRYPGGTLDFGTMAYTELNSRVIHEGDGQCTLSSTAAGVSAFTIGSNATTVNRSGLSGFQIIGYVASTSPLVSLNNTNECFIANVDAVAGGSILSAVDVNGGANCYNTRIDRLRTFGPFGASLRGGASGLVQGLYLGGGWSFGSTTQAAIQLFNVSGVGISYGEALTCFRGLQTFPGPGQVVMALQFGGRVLFDTSTQEGIALFDNGGYVERVFGAGVWCNSSGSGPTKCANFRASGSAAGRISGIDLASCVFGNAGQHGVTLTNVDGARFTSCAADGNGAGGPGSGYYIGPGSRNVAINGGSARGAYSARAPFAPFQQYGALVDAATDKVGIVGFADFSGNTIAPIQNNSTGTSNSMVSGTGYHG